MKTGTLCPTFLNENYRQFSKNYRQFFVSITQLLQLLDNALLTIILGVF